MSANKLLLTFVIILLLGSVLSEENLRYLGDASSNTMISSSTTAASGSSTVSTMTSNSTSVTGSSITSGTTMTSTTGSATSTASVTFESFNTECKKKGIGSNGSGCFAFKDTSQSGFYCCYGKYEVLGVDLSYCGAQDKTTNPTKSEFTSLPSISIVTCSTGFLLLKVISIFALILVI